MTRPNASYSKTYLTRENYRGPTLLQSIRGQDAELQPTSSPEPPESHSMSNDLNQDDNFIYGPPESSDEENEPASPKSVLPKPTKPTKPSSPSTKRPATTAASDRPKRRKLKDEPSIDLLKAPEDTDAASAELFPGFISSGSQKRRQNKVYGNKKFLKVDPIDVEPRPKQTGQAFKSYDPIETHAKAIEKTDFVHISEVPELEATRSKTRSRRKLDIPNLPGETPKRPKSDLKIPDLPDFSSSGGTETQSIFENFDSPEKKARKRSGSASTTSSLSSVDDMFLLAHDSEFKVQAEPDPSGVCCPICQKPVHDSASLFVPDNLHNLPFQQQQKFCSEHRIADGKGQWSERGYPKISWVELESFRIREKIPVLKEIISRQIPCFYLDKLDAKVQAAKGNRRKIRNYLNEELIDVAKPGYYGPKGTRIMVNAVTEMLREALNKASQSDPTLKVVGSGAFVSAVLVPELTLQLVMEDMSLKSSDEARKVLDDSTEIGVLMHPDDEYLERRDGGDED